MKPLIALQKFSAILALISCITVGVGSLIGQSLPTNAAVVRPDPDHHTLYHLFFSQHTRQSQRIDGIRSTSPLQASAADARVAAQYNITVAELSALNRVIAATSQKLSGIEAEAKGLFEAAGHSNAAPVQAKIDDLNARRYLIVAGGIAAVRQTLSPSSWINIRGYINNQFRNTTQVFH